MRAIIHIYLLIGLIYLLMESSASSESSSEEIKTKMYKVVQISDEKFTFEEISDLQQTHLSKTDAYLLDDNKYIYIWFGKMVPNELYKSLFIIGDSYKANMGKTAEKLSVLGLKQGFEPKQFRSLFANWDVNMFPDEAEKDEMLRTNEI